MALVDNNVDRQGTIIDGLLVIPPIAIKDYSYDRIYILSSHHKVIRCQLEKMGLNPDFIFSYEDIYDSLKAYRVEIKPQEYLPTKPRHLYGRRKKIALLSNEMTLTGASIALYRAAIILNDQYDVYFYSKYDGLLKDECLKDGIPVIVDPNMDIYTFDDLPWICDYDFVIVNTILLYNLFLSNNLKLPVFWWLHDSEFVYRGIDDNRICKIQLKNTKILSVGNIPYSVFTQKVHCDCGYTELLYGIPDTHSDKKTESTKVRFAVIGTISYTKGQDILVDAINNIPIFFRKQCAFKFIGNIDNVYAKELQKREVDGIDIEYTGVLCHKEIESLFEEVDVLICPSRSDSMPTVVTEAMMNHVPAIVSDVIGSAKYIIHGENGLIFNNEDENDLKDKIEWMILHREYIRNMGNNARKVYDSYFSIDTFKKRLLHVIGY